MRALIGPGSAEPGNARITPRSPDAHRAVAHLNRLAKRFPALRPQARPVAAASWPSRPA
jgi:hypothetical protein